jgi:cytochrome P450
MSQTLESTSLAAAAHALAKGSPQKLTSGLPPGPSSPALIQTLRYMNEPQKLFEECQRKYGDMFTLNLLGMGRWVFISDPALSRQLYTASSEHMETGSMNASMWGAIAGGHSMIVFDREQHLQRRKLLLPAFHGERLRSYVEDMRQIAEEVADSWPTDRVTIAQRHMQTITTRVLLRVGFGLGEKQAALQRALIETGQDGMGSPLLLIRPLQFDWGRFSPWGRLLRQVRHMDELLFEEIRRRRATGKRGTDILSFFLDVQTESGERLSDQDVRDELIVMFMAGHDTTEVSLTWCLGFITQHPRVLAKIREEVDSVLGGRPLSVDDLPRLRYIDAVIKECSRLGPVAPNVSFRKLTAPLTIGKYTLPAGVVVSNALHLLQRKPELFADPLEFRPERFLDDKAESYEMAPFGGGSRRCIGMTFALWEMKIALATLLPRLDLSLVRNEIGCERAGFFQAPKDGLPVRAELRPDRKNSHTG